MLSEGVGGTRLGVVKSEAARVVVLGFGAPVDQLSGEAASFIFSLKLVWGVC